MNRSIRLSAPWVPYLVRLADASMILLAGFVALKIRLVLNVAIDFPVDLSGYYAMGTIAAILFAALPANVYRSWRAAELPAMLSGIAGRWLAIVSLILLWLFVVKAANDFSRIWFVAWAFTAMVFLWIERCVIYLFLRFLRHRGFNLRHIALVGDGPAAKKLEGQLEVSGWSGYTIALYIKNIDGHTLRQLETAQVDEVWLALPLSDELVIRKVLDTLRHSAATIRFVPDLFALRLINHGVTDVLGIPMFDLSASPMTGVNQLLKWCEDKIISILILLFISPLMLFLAIGVKLSSPGPIFYRQERIGLNNKPFNMLKFRSMPVDVEVDGVQWGGSAAKTTTAFGQFIRRTSLDELPQFLNVLIGDMSIVGPRPERPIFVEQFKEEIPDYMKKHLVKAGITGWAQIHGWRGDTDLKTRIEYDIYYIENWSLWLDIRIIVMTIFKGFINKHAY
ncbi:undecaprenyl-phosphate glucose phosphotransferase [Polynucleobacter sp. KF022]|uniref:undecaprenyl-phosphate glucose phosphotransferase n=1 Tax=Polynucleobacter sp. KF022 TaxID=2982615 RepID=UPI00248F878D|nr:undecaprenyl-phosphate glucose phosphotransferase [Polynucleobacter sp. KF022]